MPDSLPDAADVVKALRVGFASPAYVPVAELAEARGSGDCLSYARLLGQSLAERAQLVWSASVGEYKRDAAAYDEIAREINERFGAGLAVLSDESDAMGIRG